MIDPVPITLEGHGVRLEPLTPAFGADLAQAASDGKLWELWYTSVPKPDEVDAYMCKLKHPLADVVEALRQVILRAHGDIGEEIKWNAPSFFYTGPLRPFSPKE